MKDAKHGVYFGWAQVLPYSNADDNDNVKESEEIEKLHCEDYGVFKCMLSLGKNVQFDATKDTLEAYIHHSFKNNFYDHQIEIIICGYIRPQLTFESLEALINAIKRDVEIGDIGLVVHEELAALKNEPFFTQRLQ
jgi:riboflavin kinase